MKPDRPNRFAKQERIPRIGIRGQARLESAAVLVAGLGALGGTMALLLARAGVGRLRLVDRDRVELSNLHRQLLFTEQDAIDGRHKTAVAAERLTEMNSGLILEPLVAEIDRHNLGALLAGVDLVVDGLDNFHTRWQLNRQAVLQGKAWLYCGVLGTRGNVMLIRPGMTPCLSCLYPDMPADHPHPTIETSGIIGPNPAFAAAWAVSEAIKLLSGNSDLLTPGLFQYDLWQNQYEILPLTKGPNADCPVCSR
jgi:adenylyltransferase/sulfurtransferase